MDRLLCMEAFVRVADTLSFAAAARQLAVSKSVLSTRLQQLEEVIGAPLVHRTTRMVGLTPVGLAFLPECAALLEDSSRLIDRMREAKRSPSGTLRIHVLSGLALGLGRQLHAFQQRHPSIALDLVVNDDIVDPAREGFDCALQIFRPSSDTLVMRRLYAWRPIFCASPSYLSTHGEPRTPRDLQRHRVGLYSRYPSRNVFAFGTPQGPVTVELTPYLRTNSVHLLCDYACAGAGIVCIPTMLAVGPLLAGTLRPVLPDCSLAPFWLCAVYPSARAVSLKLRLFLESLSQDVVDGTPPWDRDLIEHGLLTTTTTTTTKATKATKTATKKTATTKTATKKTTTTTAKTKPKAS